MVAVEISKVDLLKTREITELLKLVYPASDFSKYEFRSFELRLNAGGSDITEMTPGNLISEKQKALIANAPAGTRLSFEKIRALEQDKREVSLLPGFTLITK